MSPTFYVILIATSTVIDAEGKSVTRSFTSFIIQFNDTVCKVQDNILSVNGKVIGNLTEEQRDELRKFSDRTEQWFSQLYQRIKAFFEKVFASVKSIWSDSWNAHSQLFPQLNVSIKRDQEKDDDFSLLSLEPPSFCKVN